jgi:hypothetical protein
MNHSLPVQKLKLGSFNSLGTRRALKMSWVSDSMSPQCANTATMLSLHFNMDLKYLTLREGLLDFPIFNTPGHMGLENMYKDLS